MRLKVRAVQTEIAPKLVAHNAERVIEEIRRARRDGFDLVVFPELVISGYLIGDFWERKSFLRDCERWLEEIVKATQGISVILGTVSTDWALKGEDGRPRKYNSYVFIANGKVHRFGSTGLSFGSKTLLPNYREFDESRYFFDSRKLALEKGLTPQGLLEPVPVFFGDKSIKVGVEICEDGWSEDYACKPAQIMRAKGAELIINISCSPFTAGKENKRHRVFSKTASELKCPVLYVNAISQQNNGKTIFTFDGLTTLYDQDGRVEGQCRSFQEDVLDFEFHDGKVAVIGSPSSKPVAPEKSLASYGNIPQIYSALKYGALSFMKSAGISRIVVGSSGGIDSAVTAAFYRSLLPPESLLLVNMPSRYNSLTTRGLSKQLAEGLGCLYAEVPIEDSVNLTRKQIDGLRVATVGDRNECTLSLQPLHLENVQARDRSSRILAAISSAFGGAFTCNANKAETSVGYSTFYGDLGGYLALLADLWKSEVYLLGRYLNDEVFKAPVIPQGIFDVVPSAELSDQQAVDEGKGDPIVYPYHDRLFYSWFQRWDPLSPEEILEAYMAGQLSELLQLPANFDVASQFPTPVAFIEDLERWWRLFHTTGVAKRIQAPPVIAVSSRSFGFDFRESQDHVFYSTRYLELKAGLLSSGKTTLP